MNSSPHSILKCLHKEATNQYPLPGGVNTLISGLQQISLSALFNGYKLTQMIQPTQSVLAGSALTFATHIPGLGHYLNFALYLLIFNEAMSAYREVHEKYTDLQNRWNDQYPVFESKKLTFYRVGASKSLSPSIRIWWDQSALRMGRKIIKLEFCIRALAVSVAKLVLILVNFSLAANQDFVKMQIFSTTVDQWASKINEFKQNMGSLRDFFLENERIGGKLEKKIEGISVKNWIMGIESTLNSHSSELNTLSHLASESIRNLTQRGEIPLAAFSAGHIEFSFDRYVPYLGPYSEKIRD